MERSKKSDVREKESSHRSKLREMIIKKLSAKHGGSTNDNRSVIEAEVSRFFESKPTITESSLEQLEAAVVAKLRGKNRSPASKKWMSETSEWKIIDAYRAVENEALAASEKLEAKKKQEAFRQMLDEQVKLKDSKSESTLLKRDDEQYARTQGLLLDDWQNEMRRQKQATQRKYLDEKKAREEQIKVRQERREREERQRLERENRDLAECRGAMDREKAIAEEKRRAARDRLVAVRTETAKERAAQDEAKRQEAVNDQRMMVEFKAKLDREEEQRQNAFAMRMKRLEKFTKKSDDTGAGYHERMYIKREEERILTEAKRKEEADLERERRDLARIRETRKQIALENQRLVEEKKEKDKKQVDDERRFASRFVRESQDYLRNENERLKQQRKEMVEHRKVLQTQMEQHARQTRNDSMDGRERLINKSLLDEIAKSDEATLDKLQDRLFSPQKQQQSLSY